MNKRILLLMVCFGLLLLSCRKDEQVILKDFPQAKTLNPVVLDSSVILSARILSKGQEQITAFGFVILKGSGFDTILVQGTPGDDFSLEAGRGLHPHTTYECSAILKTESFFVKCDKARFTTNEVPMLKIIDFSPKKGSVGSIITIRCENLGNTPWEHFVRIGGNYSEVLSLTDSTITVRCTDYLEAAGLYNLTIDAFGYTAVASQLFEYYIPWSYKFSLPEYESRDAVCIADNHLLYLGGGDLGIYDLTSGDFNKFYDEPFSYRYNIVAFTASGRIFFGMGRQSQSSNIFKNELWEYDLENNSWIQRSNYPGTSLEFRKPFVIGDKVYMGPGFRSSATADTAYNEFWEYNVTNDTWTRKADCPGNGHPDGLSVAFNGKGYMTSGYGNPNYVYQYDPSIDKWSTVTSYPGNGGGTLAGFALDGKLYIGLGTGETHYSQEFSDFWEYNPITDEWKESFQYLYQIYNRFSDQGGYILDGWNLYQFKPDTGK